ncbi:MAG TPA: STN and carboxypeptidase regulatory-like domain-containing protein, partial [Chitinophagaceae bacterium]|nr:STN and carboxypeptidase regulatory-like domain-containing protein [Chitinophagaceae bacterium]
MKHLLFVCFFLLAVIPASAQQLLNKTVSLQVNRQRLDHVLEILSNKGNFYFSYNSNIIRKDSLVTLSEGNKTVGQILQTLLSDHYEFRESGNYIIIRKAPVKLTIITNKAVTEDRFYTVAGHVLDDETGDWVRNASIYEPNLLVSTLSNHEGYFKLRLRQKGKRAMLTVSKEFYQDTSFAIDPGYNQQVTVTLLPASSGALTIIGPQDYFAPEQLKIRVQQ